MMQNDHSKNITNFQVCHNKKIIEIQRDDFWNINIRPLAKIYSKDWNDFFKYRKKNNPKLTDMVVEVIPETTEKDGEIWVKFELARQALRQWDSKLEFILTAIYHKNHLLNKKTIHEIDKKKPKACIYCYIANDVIVIGYTEDLNELIRNCQNKFTFLWVIFTKNYKEVKKAIALRFKDCFIRNPENSEQIRFFVVFYCTLMRFQFFKANPDELHLYSSKFKKTE